MPLSAFLERILFASSSRAKQPFTMSYTSAGLAATTWSLGECVRSKTFLHRRQRCFQQREHSSRHIEQPPKQVTSMIMMMITATVEPAVMKNVARVGQGVPMRFPCASE